LIRDAKKEVVLGIIQLDGLVRLQVSDAKAVPGHVDLPPNDVPAVRRV
jgi:hypothetical protein